MTSARSVIRGRRQDNDVYLPLKDQAVLSSVKDSLDHIAELVNTTKHAMSEYIQLQKMSSLEKLASGIAHDIRSCLLVLSAETRLITRASDDPLINKRIQRIQKVLDDLDALVNHLNLLGSDEWESDLLPRDLSVEVNRVMDAMSSSLNTDVDIHISTSSTPLPVLLCQGDVWRILNNLVTNAVEAMPNGGDLLIGTFPKMVNGEYCRKHGNARKGSFAVLSVIDHGVGMTQGTMDKIFDPLFSTKTDKNLKGHHGWGLAVTYALVRRRGGWIDVSSKVGQGTQFEVFLPILDKESINEKE